MGRGHTLLLCPIADSEAVGFAVMLVGDKGCVVGGGIGGGHEGPIPGLLEPTHVPGTHQGGDAGQRRRRGARRAIVVLAAGRLLQGQHHLDGLLLQLVQVCGTNVTAVVPVIPCLPDGVGDLELVMNYS